MVRLGRSAVYQLFTARQRESIKIGCPQRGWSPRSATSQPRCGVVYVADGLALSRDRVAPVEKRPDGKWRARYRPVPGGRQSPGTSVARSTPNAG
jgi:hypothetical protein